MLNCITHYSLGQSVNRPETLLAHAEKFELPYLGICDIDTMSGAVDFLSTFKNTSTKPLFAISCMVDNFRTKIYCRTKKDYEQLVKAYSRATWQNGIPNLSMEHLNGMLFVLGSCFYDTFFTGSVACISDAQAKLVSDYEEQIQSIYNRYKHGTVFFEINRFSRDPRRELVSDILSDLSEKLHVPCIATHESYYETPKRFEDYQVVAAVKHKCKIIDLAEKNRFYIPEKEEFNTFHTPEELANIQLLVDMCEKIDITNKPRLPTFDCPNGMSEREYLLQLGREGYLRRRRPDWDSKLYGERAKMEMEVFHKAELEGYFLIVQDYVNWAKKQSILVGPGRGCFLPDSRVLMANGEYKPIFLIDIGDQVIDAYGQQQPVSNIFNYKIDEEIMEIEFENNKIIRCTKDHKFLTNNRGWVEAQYLDENDDIVEV